MQSDTTYRFARGWFLLAFEEELVEGESRSLRYFDEDLVLTRTASGRAHLHSASARTWTVREREGMIFVWHDPAGGPPEYEIDAIDERAQAGWSRWYHSKIEVRTHPREIVENVADRAHFGVVHRFHVEQFRAEFDGHRATQHLVGRGEKDWGEGIKPVTSTATYHGPAYQVTKLCGFFDVYLINAHTPVDGRSLDLRFAVSLRGADGPARPAQSAQIAGMYVDAIRNGFFEDVAIWEHKVYRDVPVLCDADGPIMQLRRWYEQFFRAPDRALDAGVGRATS
jgi:3-ketosteroid 9alpha-monooxygenase subunit A